MIDSHCHLDHEPLSDDLENVIKRSKEVGIEKLLTISTSFESFSKIKEIIKDLKENEKIIGIGETGLDFFYNHSDKEKQISSFREHIKAAIKTNIPLIIHSRNAENETFDILNEYKDKKLKILMHCFTGSKRFSEKLLTLNAYFSASGIITFKNSSDLQETFKSLPLDNLLIETDSPFLAPVPNRGKKNEPSFIQYTASKLAEKKASNDKSFFAKSLLPVKQCINIFKF